MHIKSKKAFTFIEIIIIVFIIALLATMAIPAFNKVRQAAKNKAITNNLKIIAEAGQRYILENNTTQVDYNTLIPNYLTPINPIAGETYNNLIINSSGELTVIQNNGSAITVVY